MRRCWILLAVGACYQAPPYDGVRFRCDEAHPCPAGQPCVDGLCDGASPADGRLADGAGSTVGVACGPTTCVGTQTCCAALTGAPSCINAGGFCAGTSSTCDGVEDCGGQSCCVIGQEGACGTSCQQALCLDNFDCLDPSAPMCCATPGLMEPWGRCFLTCA